jgi:hypothetical protein
MLIKELNMYSFIFLKVEILFSEAQELNSLNSLPSYYQLNNGNLNSPNIVTKFQHITGIEHDTVVLPCEIVNLPSDMHVITF